MCLTNVRQERSMRINARLDKEAENNLYFLQDATQDNNTEIVKAAIRHYANLVREDARLCSVALGESGFIGCFEGSEDLSANYKNYVQDRLDEKYPPEQQHNY